MTYIVTCTIVAVQPSACAKAGEASTLHRLCGIAGVADAMISAMLTVFGTLYLEVTTSRDVSHIDDF